MNSQDDTPAARVTTSAGRPPPPPRRTLERLVPMATVSLRYRTLGASGDSTAMPDQANPAIRSPNTPRMALDIEKLRLWRVVRGAPRKAKVSAANAKG